LNDLEELNQTVP